MSELRRDPVVGRWVIIYTKSSLSPKDFEKEDHTPRQAATCQFCAGREYHTPPEICAIRPEDSQSNASDWSVRVVPNKFPALNVLGEIQKRGLGMYDMANGVGAHEVIIETPEHVKHVSDYTQEEMTAIIGQYIGRCKGLSEDKRFNYVMLFKNYGVSAGASVEHPHSQIIALPMVPKYVLEELEGAENYFRYRGRCIYCDIMAQEYSDKERIVTENDDFIAFCPYAPRYTFETWIMPKRHSAQPMGMAVEQQASLASILRDVFKRLKTVLTDPSYNYYWHIAPTRYDTPESYHWHIEIVPQLTRVMGFEWGTGLYIVRTSPKNAAEYLRQAG